MFVLDRRRAMAGHSAVPTAFVPTPRAQAAAAAAMTADKFSVRPACSRAGCNSATTPRWWRRPGVEMDGGRYCSPNCLTAHFRAVLENAQVQRANAALPHRHRVPLGLLMMAQGWITTDQLQSALQAQKHARSEGEAGKIGFFLDRQGGLTEEHITRALALQWNCPVFDLRSDTLPHVTGWVPRPLAREYRFVPLRLGAGGELFLAFEERPDAEIIFAVQRMCGLPVVAGLLPESAFARVYAAVQNSAEADGDGECAATAASAEEMTRWTFRVAGRENPQTMQAFRSMRVHGHLWLRSVFGRADSVVAL